MNERLLIVTDRRLGDPVRAVERALAALPAGAALVQVREKDLGGRDLLALVRAVLEVARGRARVVVNDRADVALAAGADGVHLPEDGLPVARARAIFGGLVGASVHTAAGAAARAAEGADYVMVGPIWATPGKIAVGVAIVAEAARAGVPVFAVGGVDSGERAREARAAGAHGVAVIRAVAAAADPGAAARELLA